MIRRFLGSALLAAAAVAGSQPAGKPVHVDPAAVEQGMLDATRGLMFGDFKAARAALDRVEDSCRRINYDDPPWPQAMIDQDVGMHQALSRAREFAARERWEDATASMIWIQRCCRDCHALRPKSASPSDTGSPNPPTASTP